MIKINSIIKIDLINDFIFVKIKLIHLVFEIFINLNVFHQIFQYFTLIFMTYNLNFLIIKLFNFSNYMHLFFN